MNMFSAISSDNLVSAVVWIIVAALIFWLLSWLIDYVKLPEPFNKVAKVVVAVAAVLILINAILGVAGHPIVKW